MCNNMLYDGISLIMPHINSARGLCFVLKHFVVLPSGQSGNKCCCTCGFTKTKHDTELGHQTPRWSLRSHQDLKAACP